MRTGDMKDNLRSAIKIKDFEEDSFHIKRRMNENEIPFNVHSSLLFNFYSRHDFYCRIKNFEYEERMRKQLCNIS